MQVLKHQGDLGGVGGSVLGLELAHSPQVGEQLAPSHELKHEVEVALVLGKAFHVDLSGTKEYDEWVVQLVQYVVLIQHVVHLLRLHDLGLLEHLQSEVFASGFVLCEFDTPK